MMYVPRVSAPAAVAALTKVDRWKLNERDYAVWHFTQVVPSISALPSPPKKSPTFKVYKKQEVKDALIAMFGNRCAYCETSYASGGPMDVEHFRPKSAYVDEQGKMQKPGYYWLAGDWNNLLPCCVDCNRERKVVHRIRGNLLSKSKTGKANKFPICSSSKRAKVPGGEVHETPLLLNPCNDNPALHLRFLSEGFVEPAITPQELRLAKGRQTISICGLSRSDLVAERREVAIRLQGVMKSLLLADRRLRKYPLDETFSLEQSSALADLNKFVTGVTAYRAMITTMRATFDDVRLLLETYGKAEALWKADPSLANEASLRRTMAAILAREAQPSADTALVRELCGYVDVSPPWH